MANTDKAQYAEKECTVSQADCIPWPGVINNDGYGVARYGATTMGAHRLAWINAHGPIPDGLVLDHLCRNRRCINVDHLEPVTLKENARRAPWSQVTECPRGHPLAGDNLHVQLQKGYVSRSCEICRRDARRRYQERRL